MVSKEDINRAILYFRSVVCRARGESLEAQPLQCKSAYTQVLGAPYRTIDGYLGTRVPGEEVPVVP